MAQRFLLIHERSIKEWTRASDSPTSWQVSKTIRFGDANRRGSPSRIEGLGSWIKDRGSGEEFPSRFGQRPRYRCCHEVTRQRRRGPRRALYVFDALASKHIGLL